VYGLSSTHVSVKHEAIRMHASQYAVSGKYLDSFIRPNELFGDFPVQRLTREKAKTPAEAKNEHEEDDMPEFLTDEEHASYIGIETREIMLDGDKLVLTLELSRPLAEAVEFSASFLGYRSDKPFAEMPKIRINVGMTAMSILDQDRPLTADACEVIRHLKTITIKAPLKILGNPEKILTSAQTKLGEIPMDWVSWRILEVRPVEGHVP